MKVRNVVAGTLAVLLASCSRADSGHAPGAFVTSPPPAGPRAEVKVIDEDRDACRARIAALDRDPELPGAPAFDAARVAILGRARGEPMVFAREPQPTAESSLPEPLAASLRAFERGSPGGRVVALRSRHRFDPQALRALLLREGYAYTADPLDALALVAHVTLPDLFSEPSVVLQRGSDTWQLERVRTRGEVAYRYVGGPSAGRVADLLFGDRVAVDEEELAEPLHRDVRALADAEGFDRMRILRQSEHGMLAELRFGTRWARAAIDVEGASLRLDCIDEDAATRSAIKAEREAGAARHRALAAMHDVVTHEVEEALRFNRPEGEKTADHDGELRPEWFAAYRTGRRTFEHDGTHYAVFDGAGRAWPPQVCVDFVLDTFERASGTWFAPLGEPLGRHKGRLDFDDEHIPNRRGVLSFGTFAASRPDVFEVVRFEGAARIPFRDRTRFFDELVDRADDVRPGDVIAIQGRKGDGKIHQHAIWVEWSDPITGFPYGLADQMKRPRRRTWEGIMAEAPLRSLYYRVRPRDAVFAQIDGT